MELTPQHQVTFQDFPAEILEKIFVYTLPDDPLDKQQPNMRIAPMLLCHVCSKWRSITLRLPRLWMCLHHVVRMPLYMRQESGWLRRGIHPMALEFLEWWWCNLGENHPFHFRFHANFEGSYFRPADGLPVQEHILVTLFNLVQHLDIDQHIARMIQQSPVLTFPNLKSLRIRKNSKPNSLLDQIYPLPGHPVPRLRIQNFHLKDTFFEEPIILWSSLTHLTFNSIYLRSDAWFNLIRSCINLQFGHFDVRLPYATGDLHLANPPHFTHHHLRELVMGWDSHDRESGQYMLKNLSLPSLTAFRVSGRLTAQNLHSILESMPSLVELHLGCQVGQNNIWYTPREEEDLDPLSKYAPNVQHLVIQHNADLYMYEDSDTAPKEFLDALFSCAWLQLGEPMNNFRTLEIRIQATWVRHVQREMEVNLAQHPIPGLEVAVVNNNHPLRRSDTSFDPSAFDGYRQLFF